MELTAPLMSMVQHKRSTWVHPVVLLVIREMLYFVLGVTHSMWHWRKRTPFSPRKRVCFIRHGQGIHNVSMSGARVTDPVLTDEGKAQVARARKTLVQSVPEFELVMVSPLTRALQTALGIFEGSELPMLVTPLLRERLGAPCDEGRTKAELLEAFPCVANWEGASEMREVWWSQCTEWDLFMRVDALRNLINARPERTIAVVGHGRIFSLLLRIHQLRNAGHLWLEFGGDKIGGRHRVAPEPRVAPGDSLKQVQDVTMGGVWQG